jgi:hypothetical protein
MNARRNTRDKEVINMNKCTYIKKTRRRTKGEG